MSRLRWRMTVGGLAALAVAAMMASAWASTYLCVTPDGRVVGYTDSVCPPGQKQMTKSKLKRSSNLPAAAPAASEAAGQEGGATPGKVMLTTEMERAAAQKCLAGMMEHVKKERKLTSHNIHGSVQGIAERSVINNKPYFLIKGQVEFGEELAATNKGVEVECAATQANPPDNWQLVYTIKRDL